MTDIAHKVRQTIRTVKAGDINPDAPLPDDASLIEDLMFDSYDSIELMLELELQFDLDQSVIALEDMAALKTVKDVIDFITHKTTNQVIP